MNKVKARNKYAITGGSVIEWSFYYSSDILIVYLYDTDVGDWIGKLGNIPIISLSFKFVMLNTCL